MDPQSSDPSRGACAGADVVEDPSGRASGTTRRRFFTRGALTAASLGAAGILGRMVAFTPTALAVTDFSCVGYSQTCNFSCTGVCQNFQSCCRTSFGSDYCCCTCYAGPGACNPRYFRAHGRCRTFLRDLCCCAYC